MSEKCFFPCPPGSIISVVDKDGKEIMHREMPTKEDLLDKNLIGQPISVTEAVRKYNVPQTTLLDWAKKGIVTIVEKGYRTKIDEAETSYCAKLYHERKQSGIGFRAPLLTSDGLPYELKHPKLAKYRQAKKLNN
jgi:hypothetical protein